VRTSTLVHLPLVGGGRVTAQARAGPVVVTGT